MAAQALDPAPRDFTAPPALTEEGILNTVRTGRTGTAMKSFATILSKAELEAVAAFVADEFVVRKAPNTAYHTAENGWPDHRRKYSPAYPFVRGELSLERPAADLEAGELAGRRLFLDACITCHEARSSAPAWESFPLSHMGEIIRDPVDLVSRASVYGIHDRPFTVAGLSAAEQAGKDIYDANCAFCHARDGTGRNWIGSFLDPHPRDFTDKGQTAHLSQERLLQVIREGLPNSSMPAWQTVLEPDQMAAVAAYVRRAFIDAPERSPPTR